MIDEAKTLEPRECGVTILRGTVSPEGTLEPGSDLAPLCSDVIFRQPFSAVPFVSLIVHEAKLQCTNGFDLDLMVENVSTLSFTIVAQPKNSRQVSILSVAWMANGIRPANVVQLDACRAAQGISPAPDDKQLA